MSGDKVTVIVPFYNSREYLPTCISYLLNQTYKNLEILLMDDGSNDGFESSIVAELSDSRVRLIKLPHAGVSAARNAGIENASGNYIAFADADDAIEPTYVETLLEDIHSHKCDAVICNYYEFGEKKERVNVDLPWKNVTIDHLTIDEILIPRMIYGGKDSIRGIAWRTFCSKNFIINNELKFIEGLSFAEDMLFTLQLYHRCKKIYVEEQYLYGYRRSKTSALNRYKPGYFEIEVDLQKKLKEVLVIENIYKQNLDSYEKHYLRMYCVAISNAARKNKFWDSYREIKSINKTFTTSLYEMSRKKNFDKLIHLTFYLMNRKQIFVITTLYRLKEYLRTRKYD